MLRKIAVQIADGLILSGVDSSQRDIIAYGAECTLSELLANAILIFFACLFHVLPLAIIWLLFFTALRIHVGGFHASNHTLCIIESTVIGLLCSWLATVIHYPAIFLFPMLVLCLVLILKYAPSVHPNHPISKTYQKVLRQRSLAVYFAESILAVLSFCFLSPVYTAVILNSIISCILLMLLGTICYHK